MKIQLRVGPGMMGIVAGLLGLFGAGSPARGASELWRKEEQFVKEVKFLGERVNDILKGKKKQVKRPQFDQVQSTVLGGNELEITLAIAEQFKAQGIDIVDGKAELSLKVECKWEDALDPEDANRTYPVLSLSMTLRDKNGRGICTRTAKVKSLDLQARQLNKPLDLLTAGDTRQTVLTMQDRFRKGIEADPKAVVKKGSEVFSGRDSRYGIELLVGGNPVKAELRDGLAYVVLKPRDKFTVRLINNLKYDAAVSLSIDGIDVCELSERPTKGPKKGRLPFDPLWLVPKGKDATVKGWHLSHKTSAEFEVKSFPDSVRAKLIGPRNFPLHSVTALFRAAWEEDSDPPPDEAAGTKGTENWGIGKGKDFPNKTETVPRKTGSLRSVVMLRYKVEK
jgi:hypothetical protein